MNIKDTEVTIANNAIATTDSVGLTMQEYEGTMMNFLTHCNLPT